MPDTYLPQQIGQNQVTATSGVVPATSITYNSYLEKEITSAFIPLNQDIVVVMELYAPGSGTSWPDDKKPQYRVPSLVTAPYVPPSVVSSFPVLTLAF